MEVTRREFLKGTGSLVIAFSLPPRKAFAGSGSSFPTHYFEITPSGDFIFTMDKSEMGQGVIMGQTTMFGEEADINPNQLQVQTAGVDPIYNNDMGQQITGGSTSTKERWTILREAGAEVRHLMKKAAAKKLGIPIDGLKTHEGYVINGSEKLHYKDLINEAKNISLKDGKAPLKNKSEFKYVGKRDLVQVDAEAKSTGATQFGLDIELPNMKVAIVERCPTFGGTAKSFNKDEIKKSLGVYDAFIIDSGVALVCDKYWQAMQARKLLKVDWELGENAKVSSEQIFADYKKKINSEDGSELEEVGEVNTAIEKAERTHQAEYALPYLAHATMEPMNCAADVKDGKCDVYVPTQVPTLVQAAVADQLGLSRNDVTVHTSKFLGGGFGRRSRLDYPLEAAIISEKVKTPVQVVWSREDDTKHSPMRPISYHKFTAGITGDKITAWKHDLACESIMQQVMPQWVPYMMPNWLPDFIGHGIGSVAGGVMSSLNINMTTAEGAKLTYQIPNRGIFHHRLGLEIPIHFWRSVGHSFNGFVVESFIDELAHEVGKDPFDMRMDLLPAGSRIKNVLQRVAELSNWKKPAPISRGIACHTSFDTYVAQVCEVEVVEKQIHVRKVYCVVDCGIAVNPDIVEKQMQSGIVYGLSAALHGEITIKNGAVQQDNFDTYPPLRASETPEIVVDIIDSDKKPTGVGEPGLPPIAAAVANAVFKATGQRLRKLPLKLTDKNEPT